MMAFGRLAGFVVSQDEVGQDPTGLGRWCSMLIKSESKTVRMVVAYRPTRPTSLRRRGTRKLGGTVWEQHERYFHPRNKRVNMQKYFDQALFIYTASAMGKPHPIGTVVPTVPQSSPVWTEGSS